MTRTATQNELVKLRRTFALAPPQSQTLLASLPLKARTRTRLLRPSDTTAHLSSHRLHRVTVAATHSQKKIMAPKQFINEPTEVVTEMLESFVQSQPNVQFLDGFPDVKVVVRAQLDKTKVAVVSGEHASVLLH